MNVLIIGQTPPPWGGQAVMIQNLLNNKLSSVRFCHVRMAFSRDMNEVGRFTLQKILHLISVLLRTLFTWLRYRPSVLYYSPSGPNRVPFYRDAVLLILTRWMFQKTVFHFHASGISTLYPSLNWLEKCLFNLAYRKPDVGIRTSALNPNDPLFLNARRNVIIHNGLPDVSPEFKIITKYRNSHSVPRILFVGALYESKGIRVLIKACGLLAEQGLNFELVCVGRFKTPSYESEIKALVHELGLDHQVHFPGVLSGAAKWKAYAEADIFCFPSFFESESFGLVVLEAMQFELPVIATKWRGIPSMVEDGKSGYLAPIKDSQAIAEKIKALLDEPELRTEMGRQGRQIYLEHFTAERFWENMEKTFMTLKN